MDLSREAGAQNEFVSYLKGLRSFFVLRKKINFFLRRLLRRNLFPKLVLIGTSSIQTLTYCDVVLSNCPDILRVLFCEKNKKNPRSKANFFLAKGGYGNIEFLNE